MEKLKRFGFIVVILMVGFSCSDNSTGTDPDDNNEDQGGDEETSVDEDIGNIESSLDDTIVLLQDFGEGEFSDGFNTFLGANAGEYNSAEWAAGVVTGIEDIFRLPEGSNRFDFSSKTGTYEWDSESEDFVETSSSGDIVVKFPSSDSNSSNDATFTLSEYSDVSTTIEGEQIYLPTRIQSQLELDGDPVFGFNLNEVQYSSDENFPVPSILDLEILTAPFTHSLTFERNTDTEFLFSFDLTNGNQLAAGISLELALAHSDFNTLNEDDLENLSGSLSFTEDLSVNVDLELGTLLQTEDPSENQINSLVDAEVIYQDEKIADLEFSEEDENIVIVYSDGSSETVDRYYEDFFEELELIFYDFTGDWVDFEN